MKYVLFFEGPPARGKLPSGDPEKTAKRREAVQTDEKKYGKTILRAHFYASGQGLAIVEFDNPQQIANRMAANTPNTIYKKISPLVPGPSWGEALEAHPK
jgi:hypothetical protein